MGSASGSRPALSKAMRRKWRKVRKPRAMRLPICSRPLIASMTPLVTRVPAGEQAGVEFRGEGAVGVADEVRLDGADHAAGVVAVFHLADELIERELAGLLARGFEARGGGIRASSAVKSGTTKERAASKSGRPSLSASAWYSLRKERSTSRPGAGALRCPVSHAPTASHAGVPGGCRMRNSSY